MKKTILEVYSLTVCFVTLSCFTVFLGIAIYDLVAISNPSFTLDSRKFERHQSNEAFKINYANQVKDLDEQRIEKLRKESFEEELRSEKRSSFQSLVRSSIILVIDAVIFFVHWFIARRARDSTVT